MGVAKPQVPGPSAAASRAQEQEAVLEAEQPGLEATLQYGIGCPKWLHTLPHPNTLRAHRLFHVFQELFAVPSDDK